MSFFDGIPMAPLLEINYKNTLYVEEPSPFKVNLSIETYRTEEGKPWVLPVVQETKIERVNDPMLNHDYLPILGHEGFCKAATELALGSDSPAIKEGRVLGVQCLSGTGALCSGAEFLAHVLHKDTVYFSNPTWDNYKFIFKKSGFTSINEYTYWDYDNKCVNIEQLLADLEEAPQESVVVLYGCAHNPTGMDPTHDEWKRIAEVIKTRNLFTFFNFAYQGIASENPDSDAWAIRYFVEQGLEMFITQSFSKSFGLYSERVGNLIVIVKDRSRLVTIGSQMTLVNVSKFSNPPAYGASVVHKILTTPSRREEWHHTIRSMSLRIKRMRSALLTKLTVLETPGTWTHLTQQAGFFSLTGLTTAQVDHLINHHKVFLLSDGCINICGLNSNNIDYVAKAVDETVRAII